MVLSFTGESRSSLALSLSTSSGCGFFSIFSISAGDSSTRSLVVKNSLIYMNITVISGVGLLILVGDNVIFLTENFLLSVYRLYILSEWICSSRVARVPKRLSSSSAVTAVCKGCKNSQRDKELWSQDFIRSSCSLIKAWCFIAVLIDL